MSGGIPIRVRRMLQETPIDPVQLGGLGYHLPHKKLGIFSDVKNGFVWYPGIDPILKAMIMNPSQRLAGRDSAGDVNPVLISFDTPGHVQFLDTSANDAVVADFSALGAQFPNAVPGDANPGGSYSKSSHPGFLPQLFPADYVLSDTPGFVGPNTYLWKKSAASGQAKVKYTYQPGNGVLTHPSAEPYTLEYTVANGPATDIGLRTWLFEPSIASDLAVNNNAAFISIFGPLNQVNTIRVGRAGFYANTVIMGSGQWQRYRIALPPHSIVDSFAFNDAMEPYAIDLFCNTTGGTWYAGEPTIQDTTEVNNELFQYRSFAERLNQADQYYWTPPTQYFNGNNKQPFNLPAMLPKYNPNALYDVIVASSDFDLTLEQQTNRNFVASSQDTAATGQWKAKFSVAYRGPLTDIA